MKYILTTREILLKYSGMRFVELRNMSDDEVRKWMKDFDAEFTLTKEELSSMKAYREKEDDYARADKIIRRQIEIGEKVWEE